MFENIIFDLDGTLVDSADDIIDCLKNAYAIMPANNISTIDKSYIGPPLKEMIQLVTPGLDQDLVNNIIKRFRHYYDQSNLEKTIFKDGVSRTLDFLHSLNKKMFLATNKPNAPTQKILKNLSINRFCDIVTIDLNPAFPLTKREMISYLLSKWGLDKPKTLMVGDTESDVFAARANGIASAILLDGYGDKYSIEKSRPEYTINTIDALKEIMQT